VGEVFVLKNAARQRIKTANGRALHLKCDQTKFEIMTVKET
jgi:hypothetical protein